MDSKLTWKYHIQKKRNQIKEKYRQLHWLLRKDSKLSTSNKILLYKTIIKPIWTYGLQLWGTSKKSNITLIQRQQSKILRSIINAEWYITNADIHRDLEIPTINEEITTISRRHHMKILLHQNNEINTLPAQEISRRRRLRRTRPTDLIRGDCP